MVQITVSGLYRGVKREPYGGESDSTQDLAGSSADFPPKEGEEASLKLFLVRGSRRACSLHSVPSLSHLPRYFTSFNPGVSARVHVRERERERASERPVHREPFVCVSVCVKYLALNSLQGCFVVGMW